MRIALHSGVGSNDILGVEHIEHLNVAFHYLVVNEVVVASELGCVIAAYGLVEIRRHGLGKARLVEHTIVLSRVGLDFQVDNARLELGGSSVVF